MTESFSCGIEGCDYEGETPEGLRSHVAASTDEEHQRARDDRAWEGWYPAAYGADGETTDDTTPSEGDHEGGESEDSDDSDDTTDEGGSTPSDTPSEGGSKGVESAGRTRDDYAEQWDEGESDPSEGGESGDGDDSDDRADVGGSTPSKGGHRRLVTLAAPLLGLLLLLFRGDREERPEQPASDEPEASATNDTEFSTIEG